jgi:hypothetical protein
VRDETAAYLDGVAEDHRVLVAIAIDVTCDRAGHEVGGFDPTATAGVIDVPKACPAESEQPTSVGDQAAQTLHLRFHDSRRSCACKRGDRLKPQTAGAERRRSHADSVRRDLLT